MPDSRPVLMVLIMTFAGVAQAVPQKSPAPAPVGPSPQACCFFDQPCQNLLPDDCLAAGGASLPGLCTASTCLGACCTPTGCVMTLFIECGLPNGYFQGYGVQCGSVCAAPRTCCLGNGTCLDLPLFDCLAAGGIPYGAGSTCADQVCVPYGACCLPDGFCIIDVNEVICGQNGGIFQGPGTSCFVVNCPQPPQACCLPNGQCIDLTPDDCQLQGGTPVGFGSNCSIVMCPEPIQACCLRNGCCVEITSGHCAALGGTPQGFGRLCPIVECMPSPCRADVYPVPSGNGMIDIDDLVQVITTWGVCPAPCPETTGCYADIVNCDCTVNIDDLVEVITNWGICQ